MDEIVFVGLPDLLSDPVGLFLIDDLACIVLLGAVYFSGEVGFGEGAVAEHAGGDRVAADGFEGFPLLGEGLHV